MTAEYGKAMNKQVEERLSFYESGTVPRKNIDVMHETAVKVQKAKIDAEAKASASKSAKRKKSQDDDEVNDVTFHLDSAFLWQLPMSQAPKKTKKKKKKTAKGDKVKKKKKTDTTVRTWCLKQLSSHDFSLWFNHVLRVVSDEEEEEEEEEESRKLILFISSNEYTTIMIHVVLKVKKIS